MKPDRSARVEQIYRAALEVTEDERSNFLEESCAGDEDLRLQVLSLLKSDRGPAQFRESPPKQFATPADEPQNPAGNPSEEERQGDSLRIVGRTISHYRILQKLGGGGMGVVYKAEDMRLGRFVALKFLPPVLHSEPFAIERFRREARAASALNHPNICTIHDIGEYEGRQFIVMELMEGQTLKYRISTGPMEAAEIIKIGLQIGEALEAAHAKGIIHRDIKPANAFVTTRGQAKVLDFGLAKLLRPASAETTLLDDPVQTRGPVGTLPYMAPEQALGREVDARTDIYALGMVLYEMTAGKRPFREDVAPHLVDDILHKVPPPVGRLGPRIPDRLDEVTLKCVEKEPGRRYQSAKEVIGALEELAAASSRGELLKAAGSRRWYVAVGVGLAALVILGAGVALNFGGVRERLAGALERPSISALAVLPLANLSGDAQQEFFVDGMTDELTTNLAQISGIRVTSRTSVMQFKGTRKAIPEIARELNVDAIVEGSVVRAGDRVRLTAQLIDAKTDRHLWAKSYEKTSRDVLELQDALARDIATEIRVTLTSGERKRLAEKRLIDPQAHEAYLKGRYFWNRRTEAELHKAKDYFEQAINKEPTFAPAYSGLADTYFYLSYGWGHIPPREGMPLARAAALKAIELDETAAEGHASLATVKFVYDWDFPAAEEEFKRAIALNPNYEWGHHGYSVLLAAEHRSDESIREARKAVEVDPLSVPAANILATVLQAAGRCNEVIAESQKGLELDPNPTHVAMLRAHLAGCYRAQGKTKEAFEEDIKLRVASGASPAEIDELRNLYARSGEKGMREQNLRNRLEHWAKDHWHNDAYNVAFAYAGVGDMDNAFAWIDKCIELRSTVLVWILVGDNPFQHDSRFAAVKSKMGLRD